jgi:MtrB/PioB family decaheme-associated outer membrane protein
MKTKTKLRLIGVMGAIAFSTGLMLSGALAADATMPVKGMPAADPVPFWWFHGEIEAGGRFFLNHPQKDGQASLGGKSLAKYYEYNAIKPGPFLNGHISTGTSDGLYQVDLFAKNVGYDDQRFGLEASKAGEQYFNVGWDETPHNYGYGQTLYNGVGTTSLTLPSGLSNSLYKASTGAGTLSTAQAAAVKKLIDANVHTTELGIRRDTANVEYRWTPSDAWDISINYSNMHRKGTQVDGVVLAPTPSGPGSQVPKPVDDTTQNFGLNGEYAGMSPWGKKFTFKAGYAGSIYNDASNSYTVEDPFCPTGASATGCGITSGASPGSASALMSLWPSNQANGFNTTLGLDLPANSRYVGAVSYNMMRQNDNFLPFTNNTGLSFLINGVNPSSTSALPAASLNGAINTLLSNNVLTTNITSDLKSKLSYRYYDYQNNTPELYFSNWVLTDSKLASAASATYAPVRTLSPQYTKQNADADLNWRPINQWNVGAAYGYERYDWTRADVNVTNENSGKLYTDWKPASWITARASWLVGTRTFENYNYQAYLGNFQWIVPGSNTEQSSAMRQFYLNNRDRNKAQASVSIDLIRNLTITPTVAYQDDVYQIASTEVGLTRNESWKAGIELAYVLNPATTFLFSYMNETGSQNLRSTGATSTGALTAANTYSSNIKDRINTFIGAVNFAAIPDKLDLSLSYTIALATDSQPVYFDNGTLPTSGQYPDVRTNWSRLEAMAKYKFDKDVVQQFGWKGDVTAKLRYAWERNSVDNWQNDMMQTYMYTATAPGNAYGYWDWMAYDNPNYNVHMLSAALIFKW